ncbi:ABC transporter permease [Halorarum salinum]|uniref:ABC transporter permease n=1 Tax=Halorarum salinum TaxID=2743089 RepID=A0A7D5QFY2_9EURY|nr:ABC transporter permease [Halobaculum salinum]QLG61044.1 ABC transporter permease [Halobaculum salinum]
MIGSVLNNLSTSQQIQFDHYRSRLVEAIDVFRQNRMAVIGATIVGITLFMAIFAPFLAPYEPTETVYAEDGGVATLQSPSAEFPMGTNHLGQDIMSQWIYGSRVSLLVGFLSGLSVIMIGTTVGLVAGYYKGIVDLVLMRVVDILYAIPATPLVLVVALFYGSSVWTVIIAMILVLWRTAARLIRSETMSLSEQPFVKAARAAGASDFRIMFLHIAPILVPIMLVEGTFVMGSAILLEAGVSFLGLGATEMMSWGVMLQLTFSSGAIAVAWWWVLPPGLSITALVVSFFYISRGIEDVTNPQIR